MRGSERERERVREREREREKSKITENIKTRAPSQDPKNPFLD